MSRPRWLAAGFVALVLNAGWLWAFPAPNLFYVGNVLLHIGLGAVLLAALWFARDETLRRFRAEGRAAFVVLSLCGALGLALAWLGATRDNFRLVAAHGAAGFVGVALAALWARRRTPRLASAAAAGLAVALLLPGFSALRDRYFPRAADRIENPLFAPATMDEEGGGKGSPFFPSSSKTNTGGYIPSNFFMESETCAECHADIYEQWRSSAHRFSSFNNQFYRKSIEYMQEVAGVEPSKWCASCHDHAMFFNGMFEEPVAGQIDKPEAHAGLGCMSCHSIVEVADTMGNGGFTIEYPPLHDLATSSNPVVRAVQKYVTNVAPAAHRRAFMKPFMRESEYCASCHKVHLDVPVNDYRWFRGFNEYDSWQASGVSGQGARSFYYPAESAGCADCHMPLTPSNDKGNRDGFVRSHRFPAANTALPVVNRDEEQFRVTEEFLKSGIVSVDVFAVSPVERAGGVPEMRRRADEPPALATTFGVGEEAASRRGPTLLREVGRLSAPIDRVSPAVRPGERVRVDVVVRTRKVGHFFPGGTVDSVDCWIELRAQDALGRDVFWSGRVEDDGAGPVEPGAHFYRSFMLDEHGNPINKRNAFQTRSLLYARLIPPGAADVAHYLLDIPEWAESPIRLEASVHYRKFSHYYTQFSYAGRAESDDPALYGRGFDDRPYSFSPANVPPNVSGQVRERIPTLPITTLAKAKAELNLSPAGGEWSLAAGEADYERWNDYGIGLFLQGDLRGAVHAFERVTEARPDWSDGWLNIARVLTEEGRTEEARPYVEKALALGPDLARNYYFLALILKSAGEYEEALAALRRAASEYPRDRVVLNEIARIQFLQKDYAGAIATLERVARIDPEDLQLQYTRMLAYRGLGQPELADRAERLFRRFKADEASQTRTADIRRRSPEDNNERQPIHDHVSIPLPALAGRPAPAAVSSGDGGDD